MKNLILTRKLGESVMIGDSIEVEVVLIKGNKVKLGFKTQAESNIPIHRKEIYNNIQEESKND